VIIIRKRGEGSLSAKKVKEKKGLDKYPRTLLGQFYRTMLTIRSFEKKVEEKFLAGEIPGFVHLYIGEEAIATGVMANLTREDHIQSTHRGHGHTIAKGADLKRMMAEIFGKREGCCKGKGGSMHIADFSVGMLGANGVVGGGFNLATGAALASKMQGKDTVAVVFFGDGASNRGTFHEAANMAAVWKLPVVFVCENNQYASTTPYRTTTSVEDIAVRAAGYGMPGVIVDGNDVFAVYEESQKLIERARRGEGPSLLECKTYRVKGHFVGDPERYRTKDEVQKVCESNDPIDRFECTVLDGKLFSREELDAIKASAGKEVEEALEFARNAEEPEVSELFADVYA
jgi:pyruvate dehydrogenase E1 component alpha subunit